MAKIRMKTTLGSTTQQVFSSFLAAAAARGVKEKTLDTYKQHFRSISKRLTTSLPIKGLSKEDLDNMIFQMRSEQLSEKIDKQLHKARSYCTFIVVNNVQRPCVRWARCRHMGGEPMISNADASYHIPFLPRFPVMLIVWLPDEEFPASGRLFVDSSADHYLSIEDAVTAAELILHPFVDT